MTLPVDASELSAVLWRERQLLQLLAFKLEEEQLVVCAARPHLLTPATAEVEQVLDQLRRCEADRARAVEDLARQVGLGGQPPLSELTVALDEPWSTLLEEHRAGLREEVERICSIAATTRRLLAGHLTATADCLALLGAGPAGYGPDALAGAGASGRGHMVQGSM